MARILVVDDESLIRVLVADVGESLGHEVLTAASIKEGQDLAQRGVDIVLLDVLLPDGDGLAHVETFSQLPGRPDVIIITGHGNADAAEAALRSGAWEYLVKPLRVRDLSKALTQAVQWRNSRDSQSRSLLRHPDIIGESPALAEALEALREAAASNVNVLITGETGTGKELFASALHANSLRASGPFVTVDCTTLPETLVEAHLFGHARGAFTGADRAREGLLAAADHGTLFLDEVGELPLPVQGAFLRALELRRFRPVGEVREVESDFRLVAATNRDLDDMVGMDLYRSDLRFRLRGMTIHVPPLRRRAEDIPLLAEHFTARYCQRHELPNKELTPDCYAMLADYSWPGNVRELKNFVEYGVGFCEHGVLTLDLMDSRFKTASPPPVKTEKGMPSPPPGPARDTAEYDRIMQLLGRYGQHTEGKKRTASELGISLATLYRRMGQLGITARKHAR